MTAAASEHSRPGDRTFATASPAQIRAALTPEDAIAFDRHWRSLMQRATDTLDLTEVFAALTAWRHTAMVTDAGGADSYRQLLDTAEQRQRGAEPDPGARPWREVVDHRSMG